jgi:hypothetical protein
VQVAQELSGESQNQLRDMDRVKPIVIALYLDVKEFSA